MVKFSVLVSVYAGERAEFFRQALFSIWDQQTLKPAQIVLVEDGPLTVDLQSEIANWEDKLGAVLDIVTLPKNVGLGEALNAGLDVCKYELVVRMDTDDVAVPTRFQRQVEFMHCRPEIAASSGQIEEWDKDLAVMVGKRSVPIESDAVIRFSKKRSPLNHAAAVFRTSAVRSVGGYPPLRNGQDYGLWAMLLMRGYRLSNLPEILLKVRTGDEVFVRRGAKFLVHELALLDFQRSIGFLRADQFLVNSVLKSILRLSPKCLKRAAYRLMR